MKSKNKPYVLYVAEKIYLEISKIKRENNINTNIDAIDRFIGSELYKKVSSGEFHDAWLEDLEKNKYIDKKTKTKIPQETIKLLRIQKEMMIKQLIEFPELYYAKSHYPLELSQRAFDHLWRICESYELWCKETNQISLIKLNIID
mgnify:CR=1 FL=1|tara:strand:+ start:1228 stop:1665 length:438 start_codon:yes stop_codon:yes gene_type:complete